MDSPRQRLHLAAYVLSVLALSIASTAHAFRTGSDLRELRSELPINWAATEVVSFDVVGGLPDDFEPGALDTAFRAAAGTWAEINCAGPSVLLTWVEREQHEAGDGINTIGFVDPEDLPDDLPSDTPAVTRLQYERDADGEWRIVEADIYLNASRDWSASGADLDVDLSTVLAHELGHAFGLLHPCEPGGVEDAPECDASFEDSLMFPLYDMAGTRVAEDDLLGYCYLYPEPRCELGDRGCDPIDPEDPCAFGECDASAPEVELVDAGHQEVADCAVAQDASAVCEGTLQFASACTRGEECASGLCVGEDPSRSTCTRLCGGDEGACPSGFSCEAIGGETVCVGAEPEGGCSAVATSSRPLAPPFVWLSSFLVVRFLGRLRRRYVSQQR